MPSSLFFRKRAQLSFIPKIILSVLFAVLALVVILRLLGGHIGDEQSRAMIKEFDSLSFTINELLNDNAHPSAYMISSLSLNDNYWLVGFPPASATFNTAGTPFVLEFDGANIEHRLQTGLFLQFTSYPSLFQTPPVCNKGSCICLLKNPVDDCKQDDSATLISSHKCVVKNKCTLFTGKNIIFISSYETAFFGNWGLKTNVQSAGEKIGLPYTLLFSFLPITPTDYNTKEYEYFAFPGKYERIDWKTTSIYIEKYTHSSGLTTIFIMPFKQGEDSGKYVEKRVKELGLYKIE